MRAGRLTRAAALAAALAGSAAVAEAGPFDDLGNAVESGAGVGGGATPDGALEAYRAKQAEADAAADALPLTARVAALAQREATVLGDYDPHAGDAFKSSDRVFFYVEPLGLVFKDKVGLLSYGVTVDLVLRNAAGAEIFRKDGFIALDATTRTRRRDVYLTGSLGIAALGPGAYTMDLVCRDLNSAKTMTVALPFRVAG